MGTEWYCPRGIEGRALACLAEAWQLARHADAWPGWDLRRTPLALYYNSRKAPFFLAGHPRPPQDAEGVFWPTGTDGPPIYRVFSPAFLGANEALVLPFAGVPTAFVPLEWVGDSPEDAFEFIFLLWHEGFHAFQSDCRKIDTAALALPYPDDHPVNNALSGIEGRVLLEARETNREDDLRRLARAFALVRRERRGQMNDRLVEHERTCEYYEGLATYVGLLALEAELAPGYPPSVVFDRLAGENRRTAAAQVCARRYQALTAVGCATGARRRRRFFYTGMGLALLLDRVHSGWKEVIHSPGVWLDTLLEETVVFEGNEGDDTLIAEVQVRHGYVTLLEEERAIAREFRRRKGEVFGGIIEERGTTFIFDVSQLRLTDTRFDLNSPDSIDERLQLHRGSVRFQYGATSLSFRGIDVLEDRLNGLIEARVPGFRLKVTGDGSQVPLLRPAEFTEGLELRVGGIDVRAQRGTIQPVDGAIYVRIMA